MEYTSGLRETLGEYCSRNEETGLDDDSRHSRHGLFNYISQLSLPYHQIPAGQPFPRLASSLCWVLWTQLNLERGLRPRGQPWLDLRLKTSSLLLQPLSFNDLYKPGNSAILLPCILSIHSIIL